MSLGVLVSWELVDSEYQQYWFARVHLDSELYHCALGESLGGRQADTGVNPRCRSLAWHRSPIWQHPGAIERLAPGHPSSTQGTPQ